MDDPRVGTTLDGRYTLIRRIGSGGTGVVYQAEQRAMGRMVAIKMLSAHVADDPEWVSRFRAEALTCARLQHPNTIRIFDVGQATDGQLYMAMELLDGHSVRHVLREGPMSATRVLRILLQACASLAEAHALGVIHRDIKADNVFLLQMAGAADYVKILDFSVAKWVNESAAKTRAGIILGTPQYMSPEQCRGLPLDARSDLYSLGILAFEMSTQRLPFHHADPREVLTMQLRAPVPPMPAHIPTPLVALIHRALEKDPSARFQHAGEMMQHCERALDLLADSAGTSRPVSARPVSIHPATTPGVGTSATRVAGEAELRTWAGMASDPSPIGVSLPPGAKTLVPEVSVAVQPANTANAATMNAAAAQLPTEQAPLANPHPNPEPPARAASAPAAHTEIMPQARAVSHPPSKSPRVRPTQPPRASLRARDWLLLGLLGLVIGITAFAAVRLVLS